MGLVADSAYAATIRDIRARLQLLEASPSDSSRVLGTRHTQLDFDLASLTPAVPPVVRVAVHMRRGDLSSKGAAAPSRDARWNDGGQANYYAAIMRSVRAVIARRGHSIHFTVYTEVRCVSWWFKYKAVGAASCRDREALDVESARRALIPF
jgi:hypothetical protein